MGFLFSIYMPIHLLLVVFYSTISSLEDCHSLLWSLCFHFYPPIMHSWSMSFRNGGHIMWLTGFKPLNGFSSLRIKLGSLRKTYRAPHDLAQGLANFPIKVQMVNISDFVSHVVSVVTTQLCCLAGLQSQTWQTNECVCVLLKRNNGPQMESLLLSPTKTHT